MDSSDLLSRLLRHRALGAAPHEELTWLADHGVVRSYEVGDVTTYKGQPEQALRVILSGRLAIHVDRGAGSRKIIEWRGGDVCGLMPYSRGGAPPGDTVVEETADTLAIDRQLLPAMIRDCPGVTAMLVHAMLDRARHFTSSDLYDEKLMSLGKLAAGLAHELNNPASAAARSAKQLAHGMTEAEVAARALGAARLSESQLAVIDRVRALCLSATVPVWRSPFERADREEAIGRWLASHGLDEGGAPSLAEANFTPEELDTVADALAGDALVAALRWLGASYSVRALATEIDASATRIFDLVAAVKGFTYMEHAAAPESVDLPRGIADAMAVLGAKRRAKSVDVRVNLAPDLPQVRAVGAELNQVWANLIDNALDAVVESGHIEVTASRERERVVVHIIDDGHGIPREILDGIFDPFFTTKGVGQGSGLGLDIVRRLVQRQNGEIEVDSEPGRTEFRVRLQSVAP